MSRASLILIKFWVYYFVPLCLCYFVPEITSSSESYLAPYFIRSVAKVIMYYITI